MIPVPAPLPPLYPQFRLPPDGRYRVSRNVKTNSVPTSRYNQDYRSRYDSSAEKYLSDIDKEEIALQALHARIAVHGQDYLRPPGLELVSGSGRFTDQEQTSTPLQPDETFIAEEDEEGFAPSGDEGEEFEDEGTDELAEEQDLDADIEEAPSEASYLSPSPDETPMHQQLRNEDLMEVHSPATPSMQSRATLDIDALSDLVDAMRRTAGEGFLLDTTMDFEEEEEEAVDLDADVEDMDEFQSSFLEEDSMEL